MAPPLELFIKLLEDSGVFAGDTLKEFVPPKATPKDAEELARELVRHKKLTKFQAELLWQGKGKSLVLGNYVLMEKIGQGGMGAVYKAAHRRMKRVVAIKMLPPAMMKDAAAAARFQREVEAAAKLRHSNIVAADDADEANGVHFLVMECVEGSDLSALVKKNGPFPWAQAVNYVLQAARGLEYAHGEGVVHRDIKPANLLLDKKGTVKILDMGLARLSGDGDGAAQAELTSTGTIMGTVDYMAPEQALDTKTADARADIYALGCSLYYLLTAKATYDGDSLMKKLLAHREQPIPQLRTVCPDVSEPLEAVFKKMVAKKIEDRYQTMTDVSADLERCTTGQSVTLPMISTSDAGLTNFLQGISLAPPTAALTNKVAEPLVGNDKKKRLMIGGGMLGVLLLLAGIVISLRTDDGTLIVSVDQPDAMVQVLDAEGKVEISQKGGKGKVTISVDPGKHRLKVQKDGFVVFAQEFEIESGGKKSITAKLASATAVVAQLNGTWNTPAFEQWMKDVQATPAQKQIKAVSQKLMELNPGFDGVVMDAYGKGTPTIENDKVTEIGFLTTHVMDISPVRALTQLRRLSCWGGGSSKLVDLSPLRGMNLSYLDCSTTKVADLSPLAGMPLTYLACSNTPVSDLSPLAGASLTSLSCHGTNVSDLSPLKGMPLKSVWLNYTRVANLSPLERCRSLTLLAVVGTRVTAASVAVAQSALPKCNIGWDAPANLAASIDLMAVVDPSKNVLEGSWSVVDNTCISSVAKDKSLLQIPYELPEQYQIDLVVERTLTTGFGLNLFFASAGNQGTIVLEGSSARVCALEMIDGTPCQEYEPAYRKRIFSVGKQTSLKVTVLKDGLAVTADGKAILNWQGDFSRFSIHPIWPVPKANNLFIGTQTGMKIHSMTLTPTRSRTTVHDPAFQQWMKDVAAMAAEQQVEAVRRKLMELNPGFDGKLRPQVKGGVVWEMAITVDDVTDISPIRALADLKQLICRGSRADRQGVKLTDVSPLKGMALNKLQLYAMNVSDLSPIQEMPLTDLQINGTSVSDLAPLKGMSLTSLNCSNLPISDLTPLIGMPLTTLHCNGMAVSDLSAIKDLPLKKIGLDFKPERDTELLRSMKTLETINNMPVAEFWKKVEGKNEEK